MDLTTAQMAETFKVSQRTIHQWAKSEGLPVVRGVTRHGNAYPLDQVIAWWGRRQRSSQSEDGILDYTAERARLTFHQANIAEMEAETKRAKLWPMETVQLMLQRIIGNARSRLLSIPSKFKNRVPGLEDRAYELVETLIHEACDELAADQLPGDIRASLERYHSHLAAAADPDVEPVGDAPRRDH